MRTYQYTIPPPPSRNSLSSTFTTSAESLKGTITKTLNARAKDNSTIYLEPVPSQATLKDVPGAGMVKAVPFAGSTSGESRNSVPGFMTCFSWPAPFFLWLYYRRWCVAKKRA